MPGNLIFHLSSKTAVTFVRGSQCKVKGSLKHACIAVFLTIFVVVPGAVVVVEDDDTFALAEKKVKKKAVSKSETTLSSIRHYKSLVTFLCIGPENPLSRSGN